MLSNSIALVITSKFLLVLALWMQTGLTVQSTASIKLELSLNVLKLERHLYAEIPLLKMMINL